MIRLGDERPPSNQVSAASLSCRSRMTIVKTSTSYFACTSPATTAASFSSCSAQPSCCPLSIAFCMVSFPMKVSFVWPFPISSKRITLCASSMASSSIPNCSRLNLVSLPNRKKVHG